MAPSKPILPRLKTPKNMTFPSELRERTYPSSCLDAVQAHEGEKHTDEEADVAITPPAAYTEFLNTFSPIFSSPTKSRANFSKYMVEKPRPSPTSAPSSATSASFSYDSYANKDAFAGTAPTSAGSWSSKSPNHLRRLRHPPPSYLYSPVAQSPRSAMALRSPYSPSSWKLRQLESPAAESCGSFTVRQVVTTTITVRRAPQLAAPPQGKRRKNIARRNT
ncbi:hypothetical protein ATEIFO6365_0011012600 [Aspergillus terreus]|uniref:Uncharacterized protein n=1 Tax=Aspergillus terreus TaxID=33178 RepID=A0A5M3YYA1_ASPTE|nr:hypothetical protein ATETN484_0006012600 [Aspergillus terreus]GFF19867.1 hypothetical protein ATEIFO6365_0011012600 [Aspergillus terreus]